MSEPSDYFEKLPETDENYQIQMESVKALNVLLPGNAFIFRQEYIDFGVDGELEVIRDGKATNCRAQVQLKGTRSLEPNADRSFSLRTIPTKNLNYLRFNQSSLYILHIQTIQEFRYVWVVDELRRLNSENPGWQDQMTVTVRFTKILDDASLVEIKDRIIRESSLTRRLSEMLIPTDRSPVKVEIDPNKLTITNQDQIVQLIVNHGVQLINQGYIDEILDRVNSLDSEHAKEPDVRTVVAYAQFHKGKYRTAIDEVELIDVEGHELSPFHKQISEMIRLNGGYQIGSVDDEQLIEGYRILAETDNKNIFSNFRFEYLRRLLLSEKDLTKRKKLHLDLEDEFNKLSEVEMKGEQTEAFRLAILESQVATIILEMSADMLMVYLRNRAFNDFQLLISDVAQITDRINNQTLQWLTALDELSLASNNPIIKGDIAVLQISLKLHLLTLTRFWAYQNGITLPQIESNLFEEFVSAVNYAISIFSSLNLHERRLKAENLLADVNAFQKGIESSIQDFARVAIESRKLGYALIEENSKNPISQIPSTLAEKSAEIDKDEVWADQSDEDLSKSAKMILTQLGLPDERYPHILVEMESIRNVATERLYWCDQLELLQDLSHRRSAESMFGRPMIFFGKCERFNHQSRVGNGDFRVTIADFKRTYCSGCSMRSAKHKASE